MSFRIRPGGDNPTHRRSYKEIIQQDAVPAPDWLVEDSIPDLGNDPIPATNYTSREHYEREIEKVWLKCWQMACREEEIPNVGDFHIYEIVGKSLLIVRTAPDEIKALYNVCLHRGRKLEIRDGCKNAFKCMFHGWEWNINGSFKHNPWEWDFPGLSKEDLKLPEARVALWGGFVFVNFDADSEPLESVLYPIPEHFHAFDFEDRYIAVHVAKRYPANWKATAEAFMESHHSLTTHPQFMPFLGDVNSGYDVFSDFVSRHLSAMATPSPYIDDAEMTEKDVISAMLNSGGRMGSVGDTAVPDGISARAFFANQRREMLKAETGIDHSHASDAEILDPMLYNVFPNLSVWGGYGPNLTYRWRPDGVDHTIMDIYMLKRAPKEGARPEPAKLKFLSDDQPFSSAPELGGLGKILDQDMANLPYVQEGLKMMGAEIPVIFANYTEMRIRLQHLTLKKLIEN